MKPYLGGVTGNEGCYMGDDIISKNTVIGFWFPKRVESNRNPMGQ